VENAFSVDQRHFNRIRHT